MRDVGHSLLFLLEEGDSQVGAFVQITASTSAIVGLPRWLPHNSPAQSGHSLVQAWSWLGEPRSLNSDMGFPRTQCWGSSCFPSVGLRFPSGLGRADAGAACRMLCVGMEGGCGSCCSRKECCGCWEVLWGLGLVLDFPLDILMHVLQTIPSLVGYVGV